MLSFRPKKKLAKMLRTQPLRTLKLKIWKLLPCVRSSHQRCSIKKGALKNFAKFTGKHLCQSLFFLLLWFKKWLINMQLRSVLLVMPVNKKKKIAKFHFPLKNAELNKQWIHFLNRRDWLATKPSVLRELHFEQKYLRWALQWLMNPVPNVYPQKLLS